MLTSPKNSDRAITGARQTSDDRCTVGRLTVRMAFLGLAFPLACTVGVDPPSEWNGADTQIRRLTRTEYNNTIRDLLDDSSRPADLFDPDGDYEGFDNNAGVLRTNMPGADKFVAVASKVVDNAFRAGSSGRARILDWGKCGDQLTESCAVDAIAVFARKAWRRPVEAIELEGLMTALKTASDQGDTVEAGVRLAFRTILVSPNFIFRIEANPQGRTGQRPLTAHELATRLSYFLWSTTPDDELAAAADDGSLTRPEVYSEQVARMLASDRAEALVNNFAAQWLDTRRLQSSAPDPAVYPTFDEPLRQAMADEQLHFFRDFLNSDKPIPDMLATDFTYANDRLAAHYGLAPISGKEMVRITLTPDIPRGGILTQAALLTTLSMPTRTEIPRRGLWILSRLLCEPVPPPPPDVPPVDVENLPPNSTPRDVLKRHAEKGGSCRSCHIAMDPIGWSMEHYDGIGAWRDAYPNNAIDATGELPGGITFNGVTGPNGLAQTIKNDPRFLQCFTRTLLGYALGRLPDSAEDQRLVRALADKLNRPEYGASLRDLLSLITNSQAFQNRGERP